MKQRQRDHFPFDVREFRFDIFTRSLIAGTNTASGILKRLTENSKCQMVNAQRQVSNAFSFAASSFSLRSRPLATNVDSQSFLT